MRKPKPKAVTIGFDPVLLREAKGVARVLAIPFRELVESALRRELDARELESPSLRGVRASARAVVATEES